MASSFKNTLSVKGAKYNRRIQDEYREKIVDSKLPEQLKRSNDITHDVTAPIINSNIPPPYSPISGLNNNASVKSQKATIEDSNTDEGAIVQKNDVVDSGEKYWKMGNDSKPGQEDVVIIHVCDENQQISKDFCCKRDILVRYMKYFEKFLAENENGYDDIDISVHCDVEIFEWLMTYIHEPDNPPKIDKSIIVSILISSEFLQMDSLVDLCIQHVSNNLNEIIKLPIDLSCISEKLVNKIAYLTHPKTLSETRDRKDKILTKLYKRRVELDFSRKGSSGKYGGAGVMSGLYHNAVVGVGAVPSRTIAASLTCCCHCGTVYLENYVQFLSCRSSPPTVDFRGQLASRHSSIVGWSLTSYLKTLHSGGMGWDAIYWHVWAACVVFRVEHTVISCLEVDRYTVEPDGLYIKSSVLKDLEITADEDSQVDSLGTSKYTSASLLPPKVPASMFSLSAGDDTNRSNSHEISPRYKLYVTKNADINFENMNSSITPSLNPSRPAEILTQEIFDLICLQMKHIVGLQHKQLINNTMQAMVLAVKNAHTPKPLDFGEILWGLKPIVVSALNEPLFLGASGDVGGSSGGVVGGRGGGSVGAVGARRGRSPARATRSTSVEPRKQQAHTLSKGRASIHGSTGIADRYNAAASNTGGNDTGSKVIDTGSGLGSTDNSDQETGVNSSNSINNSRPPVVGSSERRSRSSSTGTVQRGMSRLSSSANGAGAKLGNGVIGKSKSQQGNNSDDTGDDDDSDTNIGTDENNYAVNAGGDSEDSMISRHEIAVLKSVPPDVQHRINQNQGPVYGVWVVPHPLQLQSPLHTEQLQQAADSSLPPSKKIEWELDIMREFDLRRMERYERLLLSRRHWAGIDAQYDSLRKAAPPTVTVGTGKRGTVIGAGFTNALPQSRSAINSSNSTGSGSSGGSFSNKVANGGEYYKDRGRQPTKC